MNASMTTTEITTTDPADVRADREVSAEGMPAIYSKLRLAPHPSWSRGANGTARSLGTAAVTFQMLGSTRVPSPKIPLRRCRPTATARRRERDHR